LAAARRVVARLLSTVAADDGAERVVGDHGTGEASTAVTAAAIERIVHQAVNPFCLIDDTGTELWAGE
jgi:hypothetical protein